MTPYSVIAGIFALAAVPLPGQGTNIPAVANVCVMSITLSGLIHPFTEPRGSIAFYAIASGQ